ncbi:glutathione peroxidase gpx1 [Clonorchis sinensis]|uniref:Glutathione peroxidase n=1 Tax=Clonorchis sinensis TaxID=79923 RepID=A0A8T1M3C4_CLOSI|nr:glutathione peroxidase gpx1 [Clonorchis sinensis]
MDGQEVSLMKYRNYRQLQDLHTRLSGKGLRILAFPCNQFGNQEPWPEAEIRRWVVEKYGVSFDMFSKIDVNGTNAHPLFQYLKHETHGFPTDEIEWNFGKFLVDRRGIPRKRYIPKMDPLDIEKDILELLEE